MTTKTIDAEVTRRMQAIRQREHDALAAQLRAQAEAELAAEQARQEREAHIAQLRARIPVELDPAPLEEARANLRAALAAYMRSCAAYDRTHVALWSELSNLASSGGLPADMAAQHVYGGTVTSAGVDYRKSRCQTTLVTAALETFRQHYPREGFDLGRPMD